MWNGAEKQFVISAAINNHKVSMSSNLFVFSFTFDISSFSETEKPDVLATFIIAFQKPVSGEWICLWLN